MIAEALEIGVPPVREPFAEVAARLGVTEAEILAAARDMTASGLIRRFGAFFDHSRVGYRGYLFGADTSGAAGAGAVARICANPSVTHAYMRRHTLNFWFTAIFRDEGGARDICSHLRRVALPFVALETIAAVKLRPSFAGRGEDAPPRESNFKPFVPDVTSMKIIRALQGELELASRPFDAAAASSGVDADDFPGRVSDLAEAGVLRRIGASFDHYRAGWTSNSLCAAAVSRENARDAAASVARWPWLSHCYLRNPIDCEIRGGWPYNLYAMIHASSDDVLARREDILRGELGAGEFVSLRTVAELKKTSFRMEMGDFCC
jgi:DNA-binding Lrp family transcriptional regulator